MNMLGVFADEMHSIGVPYEFMSWTSAVEYPYFIGEYSETIQTTEDGYKESTITVIVRNPVVALTALLKSTLLTLCFIISTPT